MARVPDERLEALGGRQRLSRKELEMMWFIWEHPEGISSEMIYAHFPQARSTKSTLLTHISEKGYVENRQEGLHHIYKFLVSRAEYEKALLHQQLMESLGSNSMERMVAAFCGKERLTEKQREKVRELLKELERDAEAGERVD